MGSTYPDYFCFSRIENHSSWFIIWLEAPESTYHTFLGCNVLPSIELAFYFITNIWSFPACLECSSYSISVDFQVWLCLICLCPNQPSSSNNSFPCGPFFHSTNNLSTSSTTLNLLACEGSIPIVFSSLLPFLVLATLHVCRTTSLPMPTGHIHLSLQHPPVRVCTP